MRLTRPSDSERAARSELPPSVSGRVAAALLSPGRALAAAALSALGRGGDDNTVAAGTLARTVAQVFVHPIDTIKTRLQVSEPPKKLRKWRKKLAKGKNQIIVPVGRHGRTLTVPNWAYKGPGDIYRGVTGAVLGTLPTALVYFLVYDRTSEALERAGWPHQRARSDGEHQDRAASVHLLSAACGALASSVVRVPGDTIRHQTQAYMHRNVFAAARTILSTRGVGGLYLGYLPTLLRDVPELAVQFTVYEALRKGVMRHRAHQWGDPQHKLATWEHLLLGGLAGAAAASVTMPLDFVKTRQQCGAVGGVAALVRGVVAAEGYRGLFSGLGPRVCHVAATSSVFFGLFEGCKLLLKPDRTEQDRLLLPKLIRKRRDHVWKRQLVLE